jgi:monofunctional biosynthetic peptidoglycan transglycosylase
LRAPRFLYNKKLKAVAGILLALFILDVGSAFIYPNVSKYKKYNPPKSSMMEYREKQMKAEGKEIHIKRKWVPFSRISPYAIKAVLIAEDDKFWHHSGFDIEGMETALEKDIKKHRLKAGGSTITQQLAKNLFLSPSRNPVRKLKEAVLAWRMERTLSKRRILELYMNYAEWGPGIFGIEAASRHYYGIPASALNAEQAAKLATVLPNPNIYSPVKPDRYVQRRSAIIYKIMVKRGIVMPDFEEAMNPAKEVTMKKEHPFSNETTSAVTPEKSGPSQFPNFTAK